jgi:hypothetical protein
MEVTQTSLLMSRNPAPELKHDIVVHEGFVTLSNNNDGYYTQYFNNREEVEQFISELREAMDNIWPDGVDPQKLQEECYQKREEERQEYLRNNPPRPLTPEDIERNKRLVELLNKLANDDSYYIRSHVAENPGFITPKHI